MNGIYIIRAKGTDHYKVGTTLDFKDRMEVIKHGSPHPLQKLCYVRFESVDDFQAAGKMVSSFLRDNGKEMPLDWYCVGKEVAEEAAEMLQNSE